MRQKSNIPQYIFPLLTKYLETQSIWTLSDFIVSEITIPHSVVLFFKKIRACTSSF